MKKVFQAQSTLELIMVIILVLAGIFVMGPYVVRSVNAYMRSWEISVSQANSNPNVALNPSEIPGSVPPPPPTCSQFSGSQGLCETNDGTLDCTWKTVVNHSGGSCFTTTYCVATTTLSQCQLPWGHTCAQITDMGICSAMAGCYHSGPPCQGTPICGAYTTATACANAGGGGGFCYWHPIPTCDHPWFPGDPCCVSHASCPPCMIQ
ncbi:MAG TPA: hypothetical protein PLO93_03820 [Candidatus Omnitrophota bacterium]|nr:hypothetical protein [Candidatus Omnitrophota bacterium]HQL41403.1 hypothetical protein [Candidatus Omnitrophota bacterium]